MSSTKGTAPKQAPTLQVRVFYCGELVATEEIRGGLNAMKGAK